MNVQFKIDAPVVPRPPSIHGVQQLVATSFGLSIDSMTRPSRRIEHARPRQIAMYLADKLCGKSSGQIGQAFHRDHSTVIHAVHVIERKRRVDVALDAMLRQAERTLRHGVRLGTMDLVEEVERGLLECAVAVSGRLRDAMLRDPINTLAKLEEAFPAHTSKEFPR